MTIDELITILKRFPLDTTVLISSDEEGNRYGHIDALPGACILKDGEIHDATKETLNTIILYPREQIS